MNKAIIFLAIIVIVLAYTEASKDRCRPACHKNVHSKITCVRDGKECRKIRHCKLQEVNCRRRLLKRRPLHSTSLSLCRKIKGPLGSGPCASIRHPRSIRRECSRIHCTEHSKKLSCYRSKRNNCRLLTSCQVSRANCKRGQHKRLEQTDPHACAGLKKAGRKQKCRTIPKKG